MEITTSTTVLKETCTKNIDNYQFNTKLDEKSTNERFYLQLFFGLTLG